MNDERRVIERRKVLVIFKIPAYVTTPLVSIPGGTEFDLCLIEFIYPFVRYLYLQIMMIHRHTP